MPSEVGRKARERCVSSDTELPGGSSDSVADTPLSRYEVEVAAGRGAGRLLAVGRPRLFETSFAVAQPRLFALDALEEEGGWIKAVRLEDYAPKKPRRPRKLRRALFPYHEAWG